MTNQREQRLRRRADFDAVFRAGRGAASGPLAARAIDRSGQLEAESPCRFGFAINRRVGGAVVRNRIRRRLREVARAINDSGACRGMDVVVVARPGAANADFQQLDSALQRLVRRVQRPNRGEA